MQFNFQIPEKMPTMSIKELLEDYFLIPRKIRHFLRISQVNRICFHPNCKSFYRFIQKFLAKQDPGRGSLVADL